MENKWMRFLSLLLALVMVIALMPVGQVRAEENVIDLMINQTRTFTVDGEYSVDDIDFDAEVLAVTADFVPAISYQLVSAESIEADKEYVIVNMRCYYWNQANYAVLTGETNGSGLWLRGGIGSINADTPFWTIKTCGNGYSMSTTVNGEEKYLNITDGSGGANTVDSAVELNIARSTNDPFWVIYQDSNYLNAYGGVGNHRAGGYGKSDAHTDGGSQWYIYEVVQKPVYTYSNAGEYATPEHTTLEDGQYLFMNVTRGKLVTNLGSDAPASNATEFALALSGTPEGTIQESQVWTVKNNGAGGYYLMDTRGNYVKFDRHKAVMAQCVSSNAPALEIAPKAENANTWVIGENTAAETNTDDANLKKDYLNCVGVGDAVAGWYDRTGAGNQWKVYSVDATPVGTTTITFTAKAVGSTEIIIGDTTYTFNVPHAARLENGNLVALENCEYTYTADHKLVHGNIYIKLSGSSGTTPGTNSDGDTVTAETEEGSKTVHLKFQDSSGTNRYLHFYSHTLVGWDRCSGNNMNLNDHPEGDKKGTHALYLFKADENADAGSLIPGYTRVTTLEENGKYLIVGKHNNGTYYVMAPSTSNTDDDHIAELHTSHVHTDGESVYTKAESGYTKTILCSGCGLEIRSESVDKFGISYTNVSLDNDLKVHFAFEKALMTDWTGCYAVIEKGDETKTIPMGEWSDTGIKGTDYYYVTFDGVAAKEMTDEFRVTIFKADGTAISEVYTDSVKGYAHRVLNGNYSDAYKTVMEDMLNYGAEAQIAFGYKTGNLAANVDGVTYDVAFEDSMTCTDGIEYLANVKLESNIQFLMAFTGINPDTMTATVTFTDWNGVVHTVTPAFTESGRFHYITIEETVIADGRLPISCVIVDKNGGTVVDVTDSIASYAARAAVKDAENVDLYKAMMKFSDSTVDYLNSEKAN